MSSSLFSAVVIFIMLCNCFPQIRSVKEEDNTLIRLPSEEEEVGLCKKSEVPQSCPVNCFRADPVCGVDGVTYWCGCADAYCAGTQVAKLGFCEIGGNGGSGNAVPISGQALLLVHIVWLILLGFSLLFGLF
ncbi:uncharacterized protein LOC113323299 [Papaver somniferum]|uniref:uncharacterized protein LOC113323299 n=1 Tax=Papaver somniferum TaxID=3469 RepID=UPI000E70573A|nr:uncharacterized protein LOC113323299 [Papaver somniferum]